jgi:hypothetical protein
VRAECTKRQVEDERLMPLDEITQCLLATIDCALYEFAIDGIATLRRENVLTRCPLLTLTGDRHGLEVLHR